MALAGFHHHGGLMDPFHMMERMMGGSLMHDMMRGFDCDEGPGGMAQMMQMTMNGGGNGGCVTKSYSYQQSIGPDGRPVVREHQHSMVDDGHLKEERYEKYDGSSGTREAGLARGIDDRSVAMRKLARDDDPENVETHTNFNNVGEDELDKFEQEWNQGTQSREMFRRHHLHHLPSISRTPQLAIENEAAHQGRPRQLPAPGTDAQHPINVDGSPRQAPNRGDQSQQRQPQRTSSYDAARPAGPPPSSYVPHRGYSGTRVQPGSYVPPSGTYATARGPGGSYARPTYSGMYGHGPTPGYQY